MSQELLIYERFFLLFFNLDFEINSNCKLNEKQTKLGFTILYMLQVTIKIKVKIL